MAEVIKPIKREEIDTLVKALAWTKTHFQLVESGASFHLTPCDEQLYNEFRRVMPKLNVECLPQDDKHQNQWAWLVGKFADRVPNYDVLTCVRLNPYKPYTSDNIKFVCRLVFYAVEVARAKELKV